MLLAFALALTVQAPASRGDSTQILRAAKAAQARFERTRRDYLATSDDGSPDPCDEIIGRYCFRYGDREDLSEPPPDSAPVARARDQLISELAGAARALPGDEWIAGQRVRYLVEASRPADAEAAGRSCVPSGSWWCLALLGFAEHGAGHYAEADSTYAAALAAMPKEERCRWTDLSTLLDGSPGGYRRLPCEARDSIERRFWWLADPLFLVPGNDRRTEHYSRWVMTRLQRDAASPSGAYWSDDERQILLRFGWPAWWTHSRRYSFGFPDGSDVIANFRSPQRAYEPPARVVESAASAGAGAWTLVPDRPRGGYVPAYAARVDTLVCQVAVFRRNPGALIVAGYDMMRDSLPATATVRAGLAWSAEPGSAPRMKVQDRAKPVGVLTLEAPAEGGILSVETLASAERRAARKRSWLSMAPLVPGRVAVSDILLLTRPDSLAHTLEAALPLTRASTVIPAETVGLYWEVYGLGPGVTPYSVALTVVRESAGLFRRAARALGLGAEEPSQVRLGWDDVTRPGGGTAGASLALDLSSAKPGRYTIRLTVTAVGDSAVAERPITIK